MCALAQANARLADAVAQQERLREAAHAASQRLDFDGVPAASARTGPLAAPLPQPPPLAVPPPLAGNPARTAAPATDAAGMGSVAVSAANADDGAGAAAANPGGAPGASGEAQPAVEPLGLGRPVAVDVPLQV